MKPPVSVFDAVFGQALLLLATLAAIRGGVGLCLRQESQLSTELAGAEVTLIVTVAGMMTIWQRYRLTRLHRALTTSMDNDQCAASTAQICGSPSAVNRLR